jgi:FeS assembly SUF system regulator
MLKISKLTDYGIVLLAHFARTPELEIQSARQVAMATGVSLPTVSKLVKHLTRGGLLCSTRGKDGGYALAVSPDEIDVASIIGVLEGPIGLTQCSLDEGEACEDEVHCPLREYWPPISLAVRTALEAVTLADLTKPLPSKDWLSPSRSVRSSSQAFGK